MDLSYKFHLLNGAFQHVCLQNSHLHVFFTFTGVFYWAGHGCYHLGDDYLIPYDVGAPTKLDDCVSVEFIRSKMLRTDPSLCLLLLDMCRVE